MATITPTAIGGPGVKAITEVTMTASDTLTFKPGIGQILHLRNVTAGALTVTLTGSLAVSRTYPEGGTVNYAAGFSTGAIAATTGDVLLKLDTLTDYLQGVITITGGTGIKASLLELA